jgi:transcriptional regulator with GAF, ATPase, and Fis domain
MPLEGPFLQSTHPNAPTSVAAGQEWDLVVVHPPEVAGMRFALRPELVLGRVPEPDTAAIPHATISRKHARVLVGMGGVLCLEDLGSRNGTRLNGKRSELPLPLLTQTLVRLGDVHLVVDERSERRFDDDAVLPGTSAQMGRARAALERAAPEAAPVLIIGETGTGKERLAREVHRLSGRSGAYVTLNCAELSPQLIESQLFGYERGAFTGATNAKAGLFSAADRGTLFLDEIGELPLDLQPKLLRVLQEGELRRVGSVSTERVNVRVVAATNRDLPLLVETDGFRRDLYARLSFYEIRLPPLRQRRQDLLAWVEHLWSAHTRERGLVASVALAPDAVERVLLHPWPDNLRGLDRLVHRLAGHAPRATVGLRALTECLPELGPRPLTDPPGGEPPAREPTDPPKGSETEPARAAPQPAPSREEHNAVYEASGRSVRATAKHFGKERRQVYRWLERYGIPRSGETD